MLELPHKELELQKRNQYREMLDRLVFEYFRKRVKGKDIYIRDAGCLPMNIMFRGNRRQEVIEAEEGKTVTVENITVEDVDINKEHSISVKGSISQESREGYNLLNYNDLLSVAYNNAGIRVNNEGYIYSSIPTNDTRPFNYNNCNWHLALEAGTYTIILFYNTQPTNISARMSLIKKDEENDVFESITLADNEKLQFTLDEQTDLGIELKIFDGVARIMLIKGTEYKPYEKYGATPSIKYPNPIRYVTGKFESYNLINTFTQYEKNHTETINGIDYTFKEDGTIVANGISSAIATIQIINSNFEAYPKSSFTDGEYFLTGCPDNNSNYNLQFFDEYENTHYYDYGNGVVINRGSNIHPWNIAITIMPGFTANNLIFKPMLIKGTEHKPFLPYGTIKNTYQVKIQNKNLFDKIIQDEDVGKYLNVDGLISDSENWRISKYIKLIPNTSYSISGLTGLAPTCFLYDKNKNYTRNLGQYNNIPTKEFTTTENEHYIRISVNLNNIDKLQLEKNTPTEFIEHQETVKNLDIPTGYELYGETDYYYKKLDKWYVHNEWAKYIFTGEETFSKHSTTKNNAYYIDPSKNPIANNIYIPQGNAELVNIKSNYFKASSVLTLVDNSIESIGLSIVKDIYIGTSLEKISTINDLKQFLHENSVYMIYPLAEPTETEITDETFSQQLEDLYNTEIYEGVTNIDTSTEYEDMVELPNLNLHYNHVTPAPSIDKPSDINIVKGNYDIISCNKNLLDFSNAKGGSINGVTAIVNSDGSYTLNGTAIEAASNIWFLGKYSSSTPLFILKAGTYYIENVVLFDNEERLTPQTTPATITFNSDTRIVGIRCTNFVKDKKYNNEKFYPMIMKYEDDSNTDFIVHQEQIKNLDVPEGYELYGEEDYFYKKLDKWYVHNEFKKLQLLSSYNWSIFLNGSQSFTKCNLLDRKKVMNSEEDIKTSVFSNYFIKIPNQPNYESFNDIILLGVGDQTTIYFLNNKTDTLDNFKNWLNSVNAYIIYPLALPTDREITDEDFIKELEQFSNINGYIGVNHISVNNKDENSENPILETEYSISGQSILSRIEALENRDTSINTETLKGEIENE